MLKKVGNLAHQLETGASDRSKQVEGRDIRRDIPHSVILTDKN